MRTVIVRDAMRIPLGKQGENNAVRVVWPVIAEKYAKLYGDGRFELVVVQKGKAYPAVVNVEGADLVWDVHTADVATAEVGSLELIYYVGDTIAKSQTWETVVVASKSAEGTTDPPEDPARAWFDAIKRQIGDLSKLTTKAKDNLVAAINEAARTGSGGGTIEMRVDGGYIQYSTDGVTWENLIAVASLEGKPGKDGDPGAPGAPGKDGEPGKDGHTPKIAATKTGKTTSITADGVEIAQIKDGEDAATDLSLGITGATVGQIAKITAVDTDGKPTKWESADMAGGETWEKAYSVTLQEEVSDFEADLKADYKKIIIAVNVLSDVKMSNRTIKFVFNHYDRNVFENNAMTSVHYSIGFGFEVFDTFVRSKKYKLVLDKNSSVQPFSTANFAMGIDNRSGIIRDDDLGFNHVKMSTLTTFAFQAGERIEIYGVRR